MLAHRASYDKKTLARQVIPLAPGYRTALSSRPVEDSALDCESKNLPRATNMSANPPGRVTVDPSGTFLSLQETFCQELIQQTDRFVDEPS